MTAVKPKSRAKSRSRTSCRWIETVMCEKRRTIEMICWGVIVSSRDRSWESRTEGQTVRPEAETASVSWASRARSGLRARHAAS
jgi:hypothetical protein